MYVPQGSRVTSIIKRGTNGLFIGDPVYEWVSLSLQIYKNGSSLLTK